MSIEAYTINEQDGTHIPLSTGDGSTRGTGVQDAAAPAQTEPPAVNGASAPPQVSPPQEQGLAAPEGAGEDDSDIPETATVDYVAKRINRLNARYRAEQRAREADRQAAQERLAQQQGQIEALTRMLQGAAPDMGQAPAPLAGPPEDHEFASNAEYVRAAARYEAQQELQAREQQTQQQRQQEQVQQMQRELLEREAAFKQAHPDFDDVVRGGLAGKVAPHVQQALMMLPDGPALAYQLAQQQDLVQRLNTLPPPLVFAELGRLMPGQLVPGSNGSAPAGTPPAPTNGQTPPPPLPEPMRPVGGSGSAPPPAFREGMSLAEYRQMRARSQGR
jgi:small-conductance mechanosensitive channel